MITPYIAEDVTLYSYEHRGFQMETGIPGISTGQWEEVVRGGGP